MEDTEKDEKKLSNKKKLNVTAKNVRGNYISLSMFTHVRVSLQLQIIDIATLKELSEINIIK